MDFFFLILCVAFFSTAVWWRPFGGWPLWLRIPLAMLGIGVPLFVRSALRASAGDLGFYLIFGLLFSFSVLVCSVPHFGFFLASCFGLFSFFVFWTLTHDLACKSDLHFFLGRCACRLCSRRRYSPNGWAPCASKYHRWAGCECVRCGAKRNEGHSWNGCTNRLIFVCT